MLCGTGEPVARLAARSHVASPDVAPERGVTGWLH